jgi:hypothetical protein
MSSHSDSDVLDDAIMPAVDSRLPGGLSWLEIKHILSAAVAHPERGRHGGHNFQSEARHRCGKQDLASRRKTATKRKLISARRFANLKKLVLKRQREATGAKGKARKKK